MQLLFSILHMHCVGGFVTAPVIDYLFIEAYLKEVVQIASICTGSSMTSRVVQETVFSWSI